MFAADNGSGLPIVLLHGYCGSHRYWDEVAPLLTERYRVIAPDLRGHGESPGGDGIYTMESLAGDMVELLDRLGIGQAIVIGHSLGGYVTLALAESFPARLAGFGLAHSTSYADGDAAKSNRDKAAETIGKDGVVPFVTGLVPKLFAPEHRGESNPSLKKALDIGYGTSPQGAIGCALGMRDRPDRTSALANSELPILLLAGEKDEVIPAERRFPVAKPNIEQVTLPNVGHMGMMEDPRAFADAIVAFVQRTGN
ncbi:alpha/beta fold hydrolase [Cohnella sp. GCM10027633]